MKKMFLTIILSFLLISKVNADELIKARSGILIEKDTGKVLYELNADEALPPASMTKMMTLLLTMDAVENKSIKLNDKVIVSKDASSMGGSQVYLAENEEYKLDDIIRSVTIASANDGAVVLAEAIGGTTENFVKMMNEKATELNLKNTHFTNVYGLDDKDHKSSARDMAKIAQELLNYPLILKYSSTYESHLKRNDGTSLWMVNTNKLIRYYDGVDGLKTGYTKEAGYCLTATGEWNNMRLISVIMNDETKEDRNKDTIALLNYGRRNYKIKKIIDKNKSLGNVKIDLGEKETSNAYVKDNISILLKSNQTEKTYNYKVKLFRLKAPVRKNSVAGDITIYQNNKIYKHEKLFIKEKVNKIPYKKTLYKIIKTVISGTVP